MKRYVGEKVRFIRAHRPGDQHMLIVPGERDECVGEPQSRTYFIESPMISRTSRYRVLLRLEAIERILETERPDLVECGDPYQVAWRAVRSGATLGIPVVALYHSHFPEAYLRPAERFLGPAFTRGLLGLSRRYVCALYNRFARTIVPSPELAEVLQRWGVRNVAPCDLGVNTATFQPEPQAGENVRAELGIPPSRALLLYVGRLAQEKNTHTLFDAFRLLTRDDFHLLIVGDGLQRSDLAALLATHSAFITHLRYCADSERLAALYRAADLFVHPGVQETFGLVALEAQACGTPVVGIRGSFMDRIIHSGQQHWARENTAVALAAAILETMRDPTTRHIPGLSTQIAARYSWKSAFTRFFELYDEVIENRRP